jgi:hypothetical protein
MSTVESIFLQLEDGPVQVAEWLTAVLPFERLPAAEDGPGEVVIRASATTVDVGTQYFDESVTVDAPDEEKWRPWVRG